MCPGLSFSVSGIDEPQESLSTLHIPRLLALSLEWRPVRVTAEPHHEVRSLFLSRTTLLSSLWILIVCVCVLGKLSSL